MHEPNPVLLADPHEIVQEVPNTPERLPERFTNRSAGVRTPLVLTSAVVDTVCPENVEAMTGSPFGPIVIALTTFGEDRAAAVALIEQMFDQRDLTIELRQAWVDEEGNQTWEATFEIRSATPQGLYRLSLGEVQTAENRSTEIYTVPSECARRWTAGTMTVRLRDLTEEEAPEGYIKPSRDDLFSAVRAAIRVGLITEQDEFYTSEGWQLREDNPDYYTSGISPYCAYLTWKQAQRSVGNNYTEHSSHTMWDHAEGSVTTKSHDRGRLKKEQKFDFMQDSLEVRYPIALTHLIRAGIHQFLMEDWGAKVYLYESIYPSTADKAMHTRKWDGELAKRMYAMRIVAIPELPGGKEWSHPKIIFENLCKEGFNVGMVRTDVSTVNCQGKHVACVSKLVIGRDAKTAADMVALLAGNTGITCAHWELSDTWVPRVGTDIFDDGEALTLKKPTKTQGKTGIADSIMKAMKEIQDRALSKGMASGSRHEHELATEVAGLTKESLMYQADDVKAEREALREEQIQKGRQVIRDDAPEPLLVWFGPKDRQELCKIRITQLEKFKSKAGIEDLVNYMIQEGVIPESLLFDHAELASAAEKCDPVTLAEEEIDLADGIPVSVHVRVGDDQRDAAPRKVEALRVTDCWEDREPIRIRIELATDPHAIAHSSYWLRAKIPKRMKRAPVRPVKGPDPKATPKRARDEEEAPPQKAAPPAPQAASGKPAFKPTEVAEAFGSPRGSPDEDEEMEEDI
tara:strand:+ start:51 stop:2279 length:2229 start_codon:yes stop_codon:yes gene_type:complete